MCLLTNKCTYVRTVRILNRNKSRKRDLNVSLNRGRQNNPLLNGHD